MLRSIDMLANTDDVGCTRFSLFFKPRAEDGMGVEKKRNRKDSSRYDRHRWEVKCDRVVPACGRCTITGQSLSCIYLEDVAEVTKRSPNKTTRTDNQARKDLSTSRTVLYKPSSERWLSYFRS